MNTKSRDLPEPLQSICQRAHEATPNPRPAFKGVAEGFVCRWVLGKILLRASEIAGWLTQRGGVGLPRMRPRLGWIMARFAWRWAGRGVTSRNRTPGHRMFRLSVMRCDRLLNCLPAWGSCHRLRMLRCSGVRCKLRLTA